MWIVLRHIALSPSSRGSVFSCAFNHAESRAGSGAVSDQVWVSCKFRGNFFCRASFFKTQTKCTVLFSSNEWTLNLRFPVNPAKVYKHYRNVISVLETYLLALCTLLVFFFLPGIVEQSLGKEQISRFTSIMLMILMNKLLECY